MNHSISFVRCGSLAALLPELTGSCKRIDPALLPPLSLFARVVIVVVERKGGNLSVRKEDHPMVRDLVVVEKTRTTIGRWRPRT
jgi:hypothetical protein